MKKIITLAIALMALVSCSHDEAETQNTRTVTFSLQGDFSFSPITRALTADGNDMTDLWVLDYADGRIQQTVHQTASDDDFGQPSLSLPYGSHRILFLASRGTNPAYSNGVVTWEKVLDTFYRDYSITVSKTTQDSHTVALNRQVAKLFVSIDDAIATGTTAIIMEPVMWYDGWDMVAGEPTQTDAYSVTHALPTTWVGQSGKSFGIWTLSADEEWTTDVTVTSKAGSVNNARHTIKDVPLMANRATNYHGNMYGVSDAWTVSLNATWDADLNLNY